MSGIGGRGCGALAATWVAMPSAASACAACFAASSEAVARTYLFSGLLLSVLPLAIVGGIAWWWRRRASADAGRA